MLFSILKAERLEHARKDHSEKKGKSDGGEKNEQVFFTGIHGMKVWEISTAETLFMGKFIKGLSLVKTVVGSAMEQ